MFYTDKYQIILVNLTIFNCCGNKFVFQHKSSNEKKIFSNHCFNATMLFYIGENQTITYI